VPSGIKEVGGGWCGMFPAQFLVERSLPVESLVGIKKRNVLRGGKCL